MLKRLIFVLVEGFVCLFVLVVVGFRVCLGTLFPLLSQPQPNKNIDVAWKNYQCTPSSDSFNTVFLSRIIILFS